MLTKEPQQTWVFDRYVNGVLMAEGVEVTRASSLEEAMIIAARLAACGPNGETPVLILCNAPDALARAEKAEQERDRIDQWRETAIVERDTYSEERDALAAELAAAQQREAGLVERAEKAEAERDKWFEGAGAHHVASMQQAQRADIAEANLGRRGMGDLDKLIAAVEAGTWEHTPAEYRFAVNGWDNIIAARAAYDGSLDAALRLHEALLPEWRMGLRSHDAIEGNGFAAWVTSPDYRTVCWTAGDQDTITTLSGLRATGDADKPARAFLLAILRALQAQSTPPISPEEAQFDAVRHHERFGPLDEKGNPLDPRRRG